MIGLVYVYSTLMENKKSSQKQPIDFKHYLTLLSLSLSLSLSLPLSLSR